MARTLTPERQKLKAEVLSLRYDYGLSLRQITAQLHIPIRTIRDWLCGNPNGRVCANSITFTHLEGDCLIKLRDIPDGSVDCLLTDPPYSVMEDYDWDKKDNEFH